MLDSVVGKLNDIRGAVSPVMAQKAEALQAVVKEKAEAATAVVTEKAEAAKAMVTKEAEAAKAVATEKAEAAKAAVTEKAHEAKAAVDEAKAVVREKTEPAREVSHKVDEKIAADPYVSTAVHVLHDEAAVASYVLEPLMGAGYQAVSAAIDGAEKLAKGEADPAGATKAYEAMHPMALEAGARYLDEKAKGASSSEATLAAVERAVEVAPLAAAERQFEKAGSEYERGNYHAAVAEAAKGAVGFVAEVVAIASVIDMSAGGLEAAEAAEAGLKEAPKAEAPKEDAPKPEAPKEDAPKAEAPKEDAPKAEAPKTEAPAKTEGPATEAPKAQAPAPEPPKAQGASADQPQGSRAAESGPRGGGDGGGNKAGGGGDGGGGENGRARAQEILNEFAEAQQKASPQAKAADILEQPGARVAGPEPGAQDAWSSGDTSPEPGRWPARPLDDPVFRAEMERARAAYEGIPDRTTGLPRDEAVKAAARTESGRTWTESGYTDRPNYTGAAGNTDRAMVEGAQAGRGPAEHPFDKQAGPAGEGQTRASHAEQQAAIEAPDEPLGVNRAMCPDCVEFFRERAIDRETPQFVADPQGVHIFMPSGQHFLERY